METIKEYIIMYLPTVLEAVITGVFCYILKNVASHSSKIDSYKKSTIESLNSAKLVLNEVKDGTLLQNTILNNKYEESMLKLNEVTGNLRDVILSMDQLVLENQKLRENIAALDKRLNEVPNEE